MVPWQLRLYRASSVVLSPLILLHMIHRRLTGLENDLMVRLGGALWLKEPKRRREEGVKVVWMHGASVGESLSALTLSGLLAEADSSLRFVITSGTVTGASMLSRRVAAAPELHKSVLATCQAPLDLLFCVRRFLSMWEPAALITLESELWPNMVWECHHRGMPLLLVDGRISARSFARWTTWPFLRGLAASMLRCFSLVLSQSPPDAQRLAALGARTPVCVGSVKAASPPLPVDAKLAAALQEALRGRLVWVAASTHEGEESAAVQAHAAVLERWLGAGGSGRQCGDSLLFPAAARRPEAAPSSTRTCAPDVDGRSTTGSLVLSSCNERSSSSGRNDSPPPTCTNLPSSPTATSPPSCAGTILTCEESSSSGGPGMEIPPLLVIIPRHVHRTSAVWNCVRACFAAGAAQLHTAPETNISSETMAVVAAYMGATGPWMSAAHVCFVGGSLVRGVGGHNVVEPALLRCAVLHGPHVENAQHLVEAMRGRNTASVHCVRHAAELGEMLACLLCGDEAERRVRAEAAVCAAQALGESARHEITGRVMEALRMGVHPARL